MINFRKGVKKSGKRTSCFYGLSWQQCKQYESNIEKIFWKTLRCMCIHCQNFISTEVAVQELDGSGGFTQPSLGQCVRQKDLGWARVDKNCMTTPE